MSDDVRMMTYVDAAEVLGVKVDSIKRRARNRRWKREKGNDGLVHRRSYRAFVPSRKG